MDLNKKPFIEIPIQITTDVYTFYLFFLCSKYSMYKILLSKNNLLGMSKHAPISQSLTNWSLGPRRIRYRQRILPNSTSFAKTTQRKDYCILYTIYKCTACKIRKATIQKMDLRFFYIYVLGSTSLLLQLISYGFILSMIIYDYIFIKI